MSAILIVEDDPRFQDLLKTKLAAEGYQLFQAMSVKQADSLLDQVQIDMILLDIMLPGGQNGFDLLEILRRKYADKKIPVLVLTNLADDHRQEARELGAIDFFVKAESSINDIAAKVKEVLGPARPVTN